ncbi:hypothetical protein, partial [Turicimonas muris]|uniref:hypothetical protein n=1 Tax=Turicimonas muris TaxID=1796652 RepID=UPI00261D3D11
LYSVLKKNGVKPLSRHNAVTSLALRYNLSHVGLTPYVLAKSLQTTIKIAITKSCKLQVGPTVKTERSNL